MIQLTFLFLFVAQLTWAQIETYDFPMYGIHLETIYEFDIENGMTTYGNPFNYKEIQMAQVLYYYIGREHVELSFVTIDDFEATERRLAQPAGTASSKYFDKTLNPDLYKRLILEEVVENEDAFGITLFFETDAGVLMYLSSHGKPKYKEIVIDALVTNLKGLSENKKLMNY